MRRSAWLVAFVLLAALPPRAIAADPGVELAGHRALYKLTLASSRGQISAASGTMAFEMTDACDGWATRQRLRITATNNERQDLEIGSDYATYEAKDGLSLRFTMRQTTEQAVSVETEGTASLPSPGAAGEALYQRPAESRKALPAGTMLPNMHTIAVIEAARAGKKFLAIPLFDGTSAEGAQDTSVAIFSWDGPREHKFPALAALASARLRIAFFDRDKGTTTPDYEIGMRYYANGVADDMSMDFGDFVMHASLQELSLLPKSC